MRVLVCGGRLVERAHLFAALDAIHLATPIEVVVEGGDGGAPALAASWARVRRVSAWRVPADEEHHGREAYTIRNGRMLAMCNPDLVLTFPGDEVTVDMVRQARACGTKVRHPGAPGADPAQVNFLDEAA